MATIILQAADERVIHKNARMLLHIGSEEYSEDHVENIKRWRDWSDKDEEKTRQIYLKRIKEKKPRFTKKKLSDLLTFDTILSSKECVDFGLVDFVVGIDENL
jgi:ATP-dependent protease ClpP protease subunit